MNKIGDLKVWWIPQVPMKSFEVAVESAKQGKWLMSVLADYDAFQLENNIKPDYCNVGGLSVFTNDGWVDWCDEDGYDIGETETFEVSKELLAMGSDS